MTSVRNLLALPSGGFSRWGSTRKRPRTAVLAAEIARLGLTLLLTFSVCRSGLAQQATPPATTPDAQQAPALPATKERGAKLFAESGCTQCHGAVGNGTDKAPSIHEVRKRKTDEQIYLQIKEGKGAMPAFGDALSEDEIRSIVAFLRASDGWALLPVTAK